MANVPADSVVRYVYGGDLLGNVWRFDLDAATLARRFTSPRSAPRRRLATDHRCSCHRAGFRDTTKQYIYFGTGQYFSIDDVPGTGTSNAFASQTQTFYGIVDDTSIAAPSLPNIRGTNGSACPTGGGDGDLVCQAATQASASSPYTATHHAVNLSVKRGFYMDVPIAGGRVNNQAALTSKGTLVFVVNKPSNVVCNPGGSSYFFQLSAGTGGAIAKTSGGDAYYNVGFVLADALSSRPVLVRTSRGRARFFGFPTRQPKARRSTSRRTSPDCSNASTSGH